MLRRIAFALVALMACRGVGDQSEPASRGGVVAPNVPAPESSASPPAFAGGPPWAASPKSDASSAKSAKSANDSSAQSATAPELSVVDACVPPSIPSPSDVFTAWDVSYVEHEGRAERMDVAWPKTPGAHPLVVMVHGGAWVGGDREYHRDDIMKLAGAGYVAATIDYRLAHGPDDSLPAQLADVRCAVRFLRARAAGSAIDRAHVAALGDSAGGHLVAMLATAPDVADDGSCPIAESAQPAEIQAAVLDYAPLDLRAWRRYPPSIQEAVHALIGVEPWRDPRRLAEASPIEHVGPDDPPMLVMHASHDHVVPVQDSRDFAQALAAAHVPSLFVEVDDPRVQHGFLVLGNGSILRRTTCTTMSFLAATLR